MTGQALDSEMIDASSMPQTSKKHQKAMTEKASTILKRIKASMPKYVRHKKISTKKIGDKKLRDRLKKQQNLNDEATQRLAASEIILPHSEGFLETEGLEKSYALSQGDILSNLNIGVAKKTFDLNLSYGPYRVDVSDNGRHLLIGGRNGNFSLIDCHSYTPLADVNVQETVRDVKILKDYTMFAVAQKKYLYIYDHSGLELHCMRDNMLTYSLDFLPYHYLLVSIGEFGELSYDDISTGQVVAKHKTRRGPCHVMRQNQQNAVMHLGHSRGTVTFWTPNVSKPVVDMLCHKGPVTALDIFQDYIVTAGFDGFWKVWDMRTYKCVHAFTYFGTPPSAVRASQMGLVGIGFGPHVQIWKDSFTKAKPKMPYLTNDYCGEVVESLCFRPFEDICCVGRTGGVSALITPGSGIANYDSLEADPFESKKQRREREIHQLLEKLQPDMITLDPHKIGTVDTAPRNIIESEKLEEASFFKDAKKKRNKMRGRNSAEVKRKVNTLQQANRLRQKLKLQLKEKLASQREQKLVVSGTHLAAVDTATYNPLDRFKKVK